MKLRFWAFLAFAGGLAFLVLFIVDHRWQWAWTGFMARSASPHISATHPTSGPRSIAWAPQRLIRYLS